MGMRSRSFIRGPECSGQPNVSCTQKRIAMALPVISVAQMREWEKVTWAGGQTEKAVIGQAGRTIARRAEQLTKPGDFILIFAGKGHNGDDAIAASEALAEREVKV